MWYRTWRTFLLAGPMWMASGRIKGTSLSSLTPRDSMEHLFVMRCCTRSLLMILACIHETSFWGAAAVSWPATRDVSEMQDLRRALIRWWQ